MRMAALNGPGQNVNATTVPPVANRFSEARNVAEPAKNLFQMNWMDPFKLHLHKECVKNILTKKV